MSRARVVAVSYTHLAVYKRQSPVILYFLWENLAVILKFPSQLQISTVAKGHLFIAGSFWETLLYPLSLFGLLGLSLIHILKP